MKKILVVLMAMAMIFSITMVPNFAKADSVLEPDLATEKIIFVGPAATTEVVATLKKGTLGIVSYIEADHIGFDVPGGNIGTDLIINADGKRLIPTTPVGLKLVAGKLYVYFSKIEIVSLPWNDVSIPAHEFENSWFPQYRALQIFRVEKTGAYEKNINYCCTPPSVKISYFYKFYLTSESDPNNPPKFYNYTLGIMIPDYMEELVQKMAQNHSFVFLELNNTKESNRIFIWLPQ
ncbi:MAG: hypothetical protein KBI07_05900 [Candidatus Atribacteria bacterium]|nr:hypothetical protein [Candidatus Atribacteria bacterium]